MDHRQEPRLLEDVHCYCDGSLHLSVHPELLVALDSLALPGLNKVCPGDKVLVVPVVATLADLTKADNGNEAELASTHLRVRADNQLVAVVLVGIGCGDPLQHLCCCGALAVCIFPNALDH